MKVLRVILKWLRGKLEPKYYRLEYQEDIPKLLKPKVLYLLGEVSEPWLAAMLCPCGCKDVVQLSLIPEDTPSWKIVQLNNGKTSLKPSVWRKKGCESHFFFTNNEIHWCD